MGHQKVDEAIDKLQDKFASGGQADAIRRLSIALQNPAELAPARAFLISLNDLTDGQKDQDLCAKAFLQVAEDHLCLGTTAPTETDLIRLVSSAKFLSYYSQKFIHVEDPDRRQRLQLELFKIREIIPNVVSTNLGAFLNGVLNLTRRLRRRGYPLWLCPSSALDHCTAFEEYARALALNDHLDRPAFKFQIGAGHIGVTPNVPEGEPDHDPTQVMTVHVPTCVDGMYYAEFVTGGQTAGGAVEYVSKLDNTDAIDEVGLIE